MKYTCDYCDLGIYRCNDGETYRHYWNGFKSCPDNNDLKLIA